MLADANAVISLATTLANLAVMVEEGWYKASQEVQEFPSKVADLKKLAKDWQESLRLGGLSEDEAVKTKLDNVESILKAEELRVQRLKNSCCYGYRTRLTFSRDLTKAMDDAIKAIHEIPSELEHREERRRVVEENIARSLKPLPFPVDHKYVPIERTITKIQALLEIKENEEPVVLFGGPGEGKTCMARHLAHVYQLSGHNARVDAASIGQSSSPAGKFSDGIFFFRCGKSVDGKQIESLVLLKELAERLGGYSQVGTEETTEDTQARFRKLQDVVFKKLQKQKVLIILDDVWDTDIVRDMFVKASGVKYLITTQFKNIWPEAERVTIDFPNMEEAQNIIANLQFKKNQIPNNLKDLIDKIIQEVQFHPYELANVVFAIKADKALEVQEWESKLRDVSYLRGGDPRRGPRAFGRSYSKKTLPDAILLGVDNFSEKTRSLLYMAAICESESVPEQVFKVFFKSIHSDGLKGFFSCRSDLEDAGLLQVEDKKVMWSLEPQSLWSIYGRRQDVIRQEREVEIESLVSTCLERDKSHDENEPDVLALLVILYGRLDWREKAARKIGIPVGKMTEDTSRERNSVTQFVHLLFPGRGDGLEKKPHMWAKKVIWKYLIEGELDDSSMSDLLNFSQSALTSCEALGWMAGKLKYTRHLFTTQHQATLQGLVKFLSDDSDSVFKILVTNVLVNLSEARFEDGYATRLMVLKQTDFLPNVLVLLRANNADSKQATANVLNALGNLAFEKDQSLLIGNFSETVMLDVIIGFVKEDADPRVQAMSLFALGSLCLSEHITMKILQFSGFLSRVVQFLAKRSATNLQVESIKLLIRICEIMDDKIIKGGLVSGTVERLVALMAEDVNEDVQEQAVRALAWFMKPLGALSYPATEKGVEMVVLTQTDFLHNSLQLLLLGKKTRMDTLFNTLTALEKFANNEDARLSIGNFSGMLEAIKEMTEEDMETRVQEAALLALYSLSVSEVIARHMLELSGFLARVVHFHDKSRATEVQVRSIRLLKVMCKAMEDKIIERGLVPGTVERLVALMAEDVNQDVQEEAVKALADFIKPLGALSYPTTEKTIEMVVLTRTDFLHNSLQLLLLRKKTSTSIRVCTLHALGKLAENEEAARLSIGNFSGMLEAIIEMTLEITKTRVQEKALFALLRLLLSPLLCKKIVGIAGVLERFVKLLEKDVSQDVKGAIAMAMSFISEYEETRKIVRGTSNVVSILAVLIADDTKPHVALAYAVAKTITLIDFDKAEKLLLKTADAYRGRIYAKIILGRYNSALTDCDSGLDIDHGNYLFFMQRSFVKAMLKDYSGSMKDIGRAMEISPDNSYVFQERGVLMRLIGDLDAALSDLNTGLKLDPNDYDKLKHRGYVKFLLGDEEGAREDAELAILNKYQDMPPHEAPVRYLGMLPVTYLEYKL